MTCKTCGDRRTVTYIADTCQPERQGPCPTCVGVPLTPTPTIPAGMVAWHGGNSAPEDWDGGKVRLRDGSLWPTSDHRTIHWGRYDVEVSRQVVAYTPLAAAPKQAEQQGVEALVQELRPLVDAAAGPNGWDWMFPLRVQPVDGKPTIVSHKGGNLFRGYIGTWQEADLLVALANAAPRILEALAAAPKQAEDM